MGKEIEYKYLVDLEKLKPLLKSRKGDLIVQGYLSLDPERIVRVRIREEKAYLTVKGPNLPRDDGARSCLEFEYQIPKEDARVMLNMCQGYLIQKVRYFIAEESHIWEVDFFLDAHDGLIIAECEIESGDKVIIPDWVTENVSDKDEYVNAYLARRKYDGKSD